MTTVNLDPSAAEMGTLLRELNHRIDNQFASAIGLISVEAVRADSADAKAVLANVVELLCGYGDVHRALLKPEYQTLLDSGSYLRKLGRTLRSALLDRLHIQLTVKGHRLALQPQRCWRLGLIVHELVTNAAKHACFDDRSGEINIKIAQTDSLVSCVVSDNGSAAIGPSHRQRRGLRIVADLARGLGGRIEHDVGPGFRSVVLSFPLSDRERKANCAIDSRARLPCQMRPPKPAIRRRGMESLEKVVHAKIAAPLAS
jgi:two-component sensor histidine kinase